LDFEAYCQAIERYQGKRDAVFDLTWTALNEKVPTGCDLRVMPIDSAALSYWAALKRFESLDPKGGFPWDEIFRQVRTSPKRFDVAIWDGQHLSGMACGMPSRGNSYVTIKFLEGFLSKDGLGLKGMVAEIALTAADHYAFLLGKKYVCIKQPLAGTERLYRSLGFEQDTGKKRSRYYLREVMY
jgi:hypothetical protein